MDDLISRQAAIDAIDGVFMEDDSYKIWFHLAIQNIPSVQTKPDSDCISRERTLNAIAEYLEEYSETDKDGNYDPKWCAMKEAELLVDDMPSVQLEREKGKWKAIGYLTLECSVCHTQHHEPEYIKFCPYCGADMRGE